ncbi:MAG: 2Fe-2S iron-sulfur cluster binding domain-containing protein [Alcaligenaceae bacterium]|nr:MAG: 2Fe-2S iron-sulfur cluster binding domain-containing protein [Alcaligenaceae bacterium]
MFMMPYPKAFDGWDEAMREIADKLGKIRDGDGPESVAFAVTSPSGTPLSDSIDWVERFIRLFGSPNTCYSTEICNWHKDFAHAFTFGCALPTADYASTDLAVLWGHNPAKSWLTQAAALAETRSRGAAVAVVDPRRSTSAMQADHWLRVLPGTDAALALGIAGLLIDRDGHDGTFLRAWSNGPFLVRTDTGKFLEADELAPGLVGYVVWDESAGIPVPCDTRRAADRAHRFALFGRRLISTLAGDVECVPAFERYAEACRSWTLDRTCATTGVDEKALLSFVEAMAEARSVAYHSWTGVGQHTNATQTERAIASLYALTGSFDAPGGNVILPKHPVNAVTGLDQMKSSQRTKALGLHRHPLGPPSQGWVTARELCSAILSHQPYQVRALVGFGANLLVSQPDPRRTANALKSLEFYVHLDLFLNPTANFADIVLPVNTPWEHEAIKVGWEITGRAQEHIQLRPRMIDPVGQSRSDTEVVFDLAQRLGMGEQFFGGDVVAGWNHQLEPLGLTVDDLRQHPGGIDLPLQTHYRKYASPDADGGVAGFATPTRRVELYSERLADSGYSPVPEHPVLPVDPRFPLIMTCAKNGYFCHSQHRGISSLRKRSPHPSVDISADLATERGIEEGQWVVLSTRNSQVRMRARIDTSLHPQVVVAEYGWWQEGTDLGLPGFDPTGTSGSNYNLLIDDDQNDPISGSVPMRSASCDVRPEPMAAWVGSAPFVVAAAHSESDEVLALTLEPADRRPLPDFLPGQHITVSHTLVEDDAAVSRSYSLTGPAGVGDRQAYTVAVRHVMGGQFSSFIHQQLRTGTTVSVSAPSGIFVIPTKIDQPVVLVAAGIGITPFLSYLETLAAPHSFAAPEVVLHYGSRNREHHVFADRIRWLQQRIPTLQVIDHYSRPIASEKEGEHYAIRGRVRAEHIDPDLIRRRARFYFCGPEEMLQGLIDGLMERGVPKFDIFAEKFHSAPTAIAISDDAEAVVRFERSRKQLTWRRADGTLLEFAEREGVSLPSGCRLGQCESCVISVLSGQVAHLVKTNDDLDLDQCLTCQAMPLSDLTLDA